MKPVVFAHRGASVRAPENTMPAFELALELGADGLELDVHLTRDGRLAVIHDERIDRTSNGTGFVGRMTLAELKQFQYGRGFPEDFGRPSIPELADVLHLVRGKNVWLNIELKNGVVRYPGLEQAVLDAVREAGLSEWVILSSFNHESLVLCRKLAPGIPTALLYTCVLHEPHAYAVTCGAGGLHPFRGSVTAPMIEAAHAAGVAVRPWTVDDPAEMAAFAAMGVDGVITNCPDVAASLFGQARKEER
jgi:glycerophosphoryl diester phosphodiesterase